MMRLSDSGIWKKQHFDQKDLSSLAVQIESVLANDYDGSNAVVMKELTMMVTLNYYPFLPVS